MTALISTKLHGVLDYATAPLLLALPRQLGWSPAAIRILTGAGIATAVYSMLTRYEFGAVKALPMPAHLALDAMSGLGLLVAGLTLPDQSPGEQAGLIALGLFELGAAMLTERHAPVAPAAIGAEAGVSAGALPGF
jgi:hypothetical protein